METFYDWLVRLSERIAAFLWGQFEKDLAFAEAISDRSSRFLAWLIGRD
jgi:hypothetical protein